MITPYVNAGVDGTEFVVAVDTDAEQARVTVLEGRVRASNEQGEISLTQGETALTRAGKRRFYRLGFNLGMRLVGRCTTRQ